MGIVLNHGHVNACAFRTLFKMTISTQFVTLQVLATLYSTVEALNTATNNKAASQYVNCDCQRSSLTFLDKQRSVRFSQSGHAWSYQACSTPPRHSAQCSGFGSGNYQQGVICKGSGCSPVGGSFPTSSGQFGSGGNYGTSGSIANCRFGQNCNVGYNTGSSSGSFNNGGFGSSSGQQQYNPYGSNGQQVSLGSILQGRKTKEGSVNFS